LLTFYSFSQNSQLNWSQFVSAAVSDFNFGAAGDWGCTSNTDATLANMNGKGPERVFGLGDYSYASTGSCFFTKIDGSGLTGKTKIAIGNHEDDDSEGFSGYMSHFSQSQTYFSYNHDDVHILVIDTDRNSYASGSAQRTFVQNDLQSSSTNPNIKWIIVYLHKPMYTSPNTCGSSSCSNTGSENTNIRNGFGPMFAQYGADLVLQGHVHNYQRTYKLTYNPGNPASPTITDNNPNTYTEGNGAIYAIVGTGGVNFHALSGKAAFTSSQQDDFFGQLDIQSTNNGNTLQGKFYRNGNNDVLDSFSITKAGNLPPVANAGSDKIVEEGTWM
jgi:predicted phosphodiesterase